MRSIGQSITQIRAEFEWYETDPDAAEIDDWDAAHAMNYCIDGIATCEHALGIVSRQLDAELVLQVEPPAGLQKLRRVVA